MHPINPPLLEAIRAADAATVVALAANPDLVSQAVVNDALTITILGHMPEILGLLLDSRLLRAHDISMAKPVNLAAERGDIEILKVLLPHTPFEARWGVLASAAAAGHIGTLKFLLPHCDPTRSSCQALSSATQEGHLDCLNLLLPFASPQSRISAIQAAAARGRDEAMDLLLPHAPDDDFGMAKALFNAVMNGHHRFFDALMTPERMQVFPGFLRRSEHYLQSEKVRGVESVAAYFEVAARRELLRLLEGQSLPLLQALEERHVLQEALPAPSQPGRAVRL